MYIYIYELYVNDIDRLCSNCQSLKQFFILARQIWIVTSVNRILIETCMPRSFSLQKKFNQRPLKNQKRELFPNCRALDAIAKVQTFQAVVCCLFLLECCYFYIPGANIWMVDIF